MKTTLVVTMMCILIPLASYATPTTFVKGTLEEESIASSSAETSLILARGGNPAQEFSNETGPAVTDKPKKTSILAMSQAVASTDYIGEPAGGLRPLHNLDFDPAQLFWCHFSFNNYHLEPYQPPDFPLLPSALWQLPYSGHTCP